jgi:hypothetical protein
MPEMHWRHNLPGMKVSIMKADIRYTNPDPPSSDSPGYYEFRASASLDIAERVQLAVNILTEATWYPPAL